MYAYRTSRVHLGRFCLGILALMGIGTPALMASNFSFTGQFTSDDEVQLFNFTVSADATVTLRSLAYGGGLNSADDLISAGGFDSFFTWYAADGTQISTNDDGGCGNVNSHNGACLDAFFSGTFSAGTYTVALTESGNDPAGALSDGFIEQGSGDFTASGTCPAFCDTFGNQDDGNWAVDISNVNSASVPGTVPEPGTTLLLACGLSLVVFARRRLVNIQIFGGN